MDKNFFEQTVISNFRFLQDHYGFSTPVMEDYGREIFIRYERDKQTVSISFEFGSSPLVEIFYPSAETREPPIPWASRNGVRRTRRIPRLNIKNLFLGDENSMTQYIQEIALEFEKVEAEWLEAQ